MFNEWFKHFSDNSEIIVNFSLINYKCSIYNNGNYTVLPISNRLRYFNWTSALPVGISIPIEEWEVKYRFHGWQKEAVFEGGTWDIIGSF